MSPYHLARATTSTLRTTRPSPSCSHRVFPIPHRTYASQSYGSGEGDPKGSDPQSQGSSPATSNAEHPGPPPPDVGKGTGGGPTKKGDDGHYGGGADTKSSSKTTSSNGSGTGETAEGSAEKQSKNGSPQPKILRNDGPPPDEHQSEDVKKHNQEMANRKDKPFEQSSRTEGNQTGKSF